MIVKEMHFENVKKGENTPFEHLSFSYNVLFPSHKPLRTYFSMNSSTFFFNPWSGANTARQEGLTYTMPLLH